MLLLATDLDQTLIYTKNTYNDNVDITNGVCVEHLNGKPLSYMHQKTHKLLYSLNEKMILCPTTTRNINQYNRVSLPQHDWAIVSNGGSVLYQGETVKEWDSIVKENLSTSHSYDIAWRRMQETLNKKWVIKLKEVPGLFFYMVVDKKTTPTSWVKDLSRQASDMGWVLSRQGRKIYFLPLGLSKANAMKYVAIKTGAQTVFAAGDSLLDAPMMEQAHYSLRPGHGELHEKAEYSHLPASKLSGWEAGADIIETATKLV